MAYNGLTNLGVEYLARMTAENKPVTFTKIKVGNGSIPASQTGASTTNLYSLKKEVEILSKNQIENSIKLQVLLNNLDLEVGFYVKELGIYVQDGEQEKLYWYINKDNPSYLPDKNTPSTHRYNLFLEVSNFETNIINFTGEGLLADKKFVEDSIEEAFNNFEEGYNATINTLLPKGNIPNSLNSAEKIVAALQGNGGLKFDENLLYLNDEGTKKKGLYYLDRLADGIFECLEQTEETVNNSAKFRDISNKASADRLDNLWKMESKNNYVTIENFSSISALIHYIGKTCICHITINYSKGIIPYTKIPFPVNFKTAPYVTADDLNGNAELPQPIGINWTGTSEVYIKGGNAGITLLAIGTI